MQIQFHKSTINIRSLRVLTIGALAIFTLSVLYLEKYNFSPAQSEGYDPLRYEYFARFGLPEYLVENPSYNIVKLLHALYLVTPHYFGAVFFAVLLYLQLSTYRVGLGIALNPVLLFFLVQTGKDGITLLVLTLVFLYLSQTSRRSLLTSIIIFCSVVLLLWVRPNSLMFLAVLFVLYYRSWLLGFILLLASLNRFQRLNFSFFTNVVGDGSGGLNDALRYLSFGNDLLPVTARFLLYLFSPVLQPAAAFFRFYSDPSFYDLIEIVSLMIFLIIFIRNFSWRSFFYLIFFCLVMTLVQPFYHGRYFVIFFPIIILIENFHKSTELHSQAIFARSSASNK